MFLIMMMSSSAYFVEGAGPYTLRSAYEKNVFTRQNVSTKHVNLPIEEIL